MKKQGQQAEDASLEVRTLGQRAMTAHERFHVWQVVFLKRLGLHATAILGAVFGLIAIAMLVITLGLLLSFQIVGFLILAVTTALTGYLARGLFRQGTRRKLKARTQATMVKGVMEELAVKYSSGNGGTQTFYYHSIGSFEFIRPLDAEGIFRPFVGKPFEAHVVELYYTLRDGSPAPPTKKSKAVLLKLDDEVDIDRVYRKYGRGYFIRYALARAVIIGPSALLSLVLIHWLMPLAERHSMWLAFCALIFSCLLAFGVGTLVYFVCRWLRERLDPSYVKAHEERLKG